MPDRVPSDGPRVGRYQLDKVVGVGARASVWRARGPDGPVAVKVVRDRRDAPDLRAEAQALADAEHPHLCRLLEVAPDGAWMATELLRGERVDTWCRSRDLEEILRVLLEVLGALKHLHARGMVHGDLKPAHVLVDGWGHPKLLDLGEAPAIDLPGPARLTLGFAAPERLAGGAPTTAGDLYAFGALAQVCLTGRPLFDAVEPAALAHLPRVTAPLPCSTRRPDVPRRLAQLIQRLLARDPARRPPLSVVEKVLVGLDPLVEERDGRVGMEDCRRAGRELVCRAHDGEALVVVLHGPTGSGRRLLADDLLGVARAEGMSTPSGTAPGPVLQAARDGDRPALALRLADPDARDLARRLLQGGWPSLLLLYGDRPDPAMADLGALHLTPDTLDAAAVRICAESLGLYLDDPTVREVLATSRGLPGAVWLGLEARLPRAPVRPRFPMPRSAVRVLVALQGAGGEASVRSLARTLELDPLTVLDHAVLLEAAGIAAPADADDPDRLRLVDAGHKLLAGPRSAP